ncbi:MAG: GNAT family acetyltransferase [Pirellulales bacterium]|nr:GNAT family acetyltransferase [Pirellulales bacterium]
MRIRPFQESDEAEVSALWTKVFSYPQPHNQPSHIIQQKLVLQRELFFVAEEDHGIVGTVMGGYDGHRGWIYALAVRPESRRQGLGTALVRHLERELSFLGCTKINLQIVASNAATAEFYKQLGYLVEERISMGKVIASAHPNN